MIQFVIFILFMRSEVGLVVGFASAEVSRVEVHVIIVLLAMISCLGASWAVCVLKGLERS